MSAEPIIKAITCEQYVVISLQVAEKTIEGLNEEVKNLNAKIAELKAERDSEIVKFIRETGRNEIVHRSRSWSTNGESVVDGDKIKTFEVWAKGYVDKYPFPKFMKQDEFIREFTPELSKIYTDLVAEAKEEDE